MSDEQTPPPPALRLKPRLRPDAATPGAEGAPSTPAPAAPPPPPPSPQPQGEAPAPGGAPKIRFKPRLNAGAAAQPAPAAAVPAPAEPPPSIFLPEPAATIPPTPAVISPAPPEPPAAPAPGAAAGGAPRMKLKARISPGAPPLPETVPPASEPARAEERPVVPALFAEPADVVPAPAPLPEPSPLASPLPPSAPPSGEGAGVSAGDPGKFKLKQKGPPTMIGGIPVAAPTAEGMKAPPPFPVVAPPVKTGKTTPPIPHVVMKAEVAEQEEPIRALPGKAKAKRGKRLAILGVVAVVVLGGAAFYIYKFYLADTPPPPPPVTQKATPPAPNTGAATKGPTPSDTLNQLAKVPANAIQKTKDTTGKVNSKGNVDAVLDGSGPGDRPTVNTAPTAPKTTTTTTTRGVAPGVTATTEVQAASTASVAFRAYVANVKIAGVVATRAIINNKLTRAGEVVDASLGITFEGYDVDTKMLNFRDRSGASVSRKYP